MIATLRQRNFALMWLAGLISLAGDWALSVGLPIYVYTLTHSVLATAITLMCAVTPGVLVGSVAGVFVDRWDHKRTMVAINATSPPLTPYAWRARRRHHRRQRPPQLHRHPHVTTHPTCASPNAPPIRWCSPPAPITDHRSPITPSPAATRSRSPNDAPHRWCSGRFCGGCSSAWSCQYCSRQEWPSRHCRPKTAPAPAMGPCTVRFQGSYQTIGVTFGLD